MARSIRPGAVAPVLALLLALPGCAGDPVAELERARSRHQATLQSFVVRDDPATGEQEILLDVLLERELGDPLPGITVDVSMADARGEEKAHRRVWIDASKVGPGGLQTAIVLETVPYAPGDGFYVEVRSPVPAAERSDYREFSGVSGD